MRSRTSILAIAVLASGLLGDACFHPLRSGDGSLSIIEDLDARCVVLSGASPPGLDFEPTGRLWVLDRSPPAIVGFDVDELPPTLSDLGPFRIPVDSDGNGAPEIPGINPVPILEEIDIFEGGLFAMVTATSYDEVLFFSPPTGDFLSPSPNVSVPASFEPDDYPFLPAPGADPRRQSGLSTVACIRPLPGALDSRGDEFEIHIDSRCDAEPNSYYSSSTSGAVFATTAPDPPTDSWFFVSVANPGDGAGSETPQYLPGAVLLYETPLSGTEDPVEPDAVTPVIFTKGFNPTHLTNYSVAGRNFVLVTVSGAIGRELVAGRKVALTDAAIEVIEVTADPPRLAATIPLGLAGLTGGLAIHPTRPIAVVGSAVNRWLLAVNLAPLEFLPSSGPLVVLDGLTPPHADAVLHGAGNPILLPARASGGAGETCPGSIRGVAFDDAGNRIYATNFCDGTLIVTAVDSANPPNFTSSEPIVLTGPIDTIDVDMPRGPGAIAVRREAPGTSPDVFVLIGQPEGRLCAFDSESF